MVSGEKIKHKTNCNLLPNLLNLIKFEVIVQNDELHKILHYFVSAVIPFEEKQNDQFTSSV